MKETWEHVSISDYIHCNVWDQITSPFPNFNGATVEVLGMDKQFHPTLYNTCDYLPMLGLKLINVSKRDIWWNSYVAVKLCHIFLLWSRMSLTGTVESQKTKVTQVTTPNIRIAQKTASQNITSIQRSLTLSWFQSLASTSTGYKRYGYQQLIVHIRSAWQSGSVCQNFADSPVSLSSCDVICWIHTPAYVVNHIRPPFVKKNSL